MRDGGSARGGGGRANARETGPPARTRTPPPLARTEHRAPAAGPAIQGSGFRARNVSTVAAARLVSHAEVGEYCVSLAESNGTRDSGWHARLIRERAPGHLRRTRGRTIATRGPSVAHPPQVLRFAFRDSGFGMARDTWPYMTLGRCPLSIFCSRGTPPSPESIIRDLVQELDPFNRLSIQVCTIQPIVG